jgi:hypothetical protein
MRVIDPDEYARLNEQPVIPQRGTVGRGRAAPFTEDVSEDKQGAPHPPWWWTPERSPLPAWASRSEFKHYRQQLKEIDERLDIAWDHDDEVWGCWQRSATIKTPWCRGWRRLFIIAPPLDNRFFATLYYHDASNFGGAAKYYQQVKEQALRDQRAREAFHRQELRAQAEDRFNWYAPKVGYGSEIAGERTPHKR